MTTIPNPGAYAEHFAELAKSDDEPATVSTATSSIPAGGIGLYVVNPKPRRHWRVTKGALEGRVAELERNCEAIASAHRNASLWRMDETARADRWKLIAQCLFCGCVLLGAAAWL